MEILPDAARRQARFSGDFRVRAVFQHFQAQHLLLLLRQFRDCPAYCRHRLPHQHLLFQRRRVGIKRERLVFPTFLPDSLPLVRCETTRGDQVHSEAYYADETRSLRFEEQDNLDGWNVRAADARVLTIYLHSVPGYLIDRQTEDTHEVSIIWAEGKRMLRVTSIGLPADEAVLVAQSVKKIFAE